MTPFRWDGTLFATPAFSEAFIAATNDTGKAYFLITCMYNT